MGDNERLLAAYEEYLNPNNAAFLKRLGLDSTVESASGAVIRDSRGREFVDLIAGYGVFNLGHNPERITRALRESLDGQPLWNRPFLSEPLATLAEKVVKTTPGDLSRVFFCSSGAEAVDSAIKLARLGGRRSEIVTVQGGFYGFTMGALSASGIPGQSRPFAPLVPGITHVSYGDVDALAAAVSEDTAAVLLEAVQAEVGAIDPPAGYLKAAREICDQSGALLMIDEVRTGMGRTGPAFAIEDEGIIPDVLMIGKSLAGGIVPVGAVVARAETWGRFGMSFAMSASSFAGNRLACVAANAAIDTMREEDVLASGRTAATALWKGLTELAAQHPDLITRLTGRGMLIGMHMANKRLADETVQHCVANDALVATAFCNGSCILFEPPLVITPELVQRGLDALARALDEVKA